MGITNRLKNTTKELRRILRLSPMHRVLRRLKQSAVNPGTLNSLEVFGGDGQIHTKDLASGVAELEIWEIRPEAEPILRRKFPRSEIKNTV